MSNILSHINSLLIDEDIEGLIEAGAPLDEYEDEATSIANAVSQLSKEEMNMDSVLAVVTMVWMQSFDLSQQGVSRRVDALRRIAEAIVKG
ncbi:hypothetical protein GC177_02130 [bacterium]|nr:hypothetical protein [bacterium]